MPGGDPFETTEDELRERGWLSPEDRTIIATGIEFLASKHHEGQHTAMIEIGRRTFGECDAQTCKYATSLLTWLQLTER
jgi:hypothetical protein